MRRVRVAVVGTIGCCLFGAGLAGYWAWTRGSRSLPASVPVETLPAGAPGTSAGVATGTDDSGWQTRAVASASSSPAGWSDSDYLSDEQTLIVRLRQLGQAAPETTLELARAGNELFPDGPSAAERNWFLVRALVNLRRFPEAQEHARWMVERFPGTFWASDVERHLLVYPLGLPSREQMQQMAGN